MRFPEPGATPGIGAAPNAPAGVYTRLLRSHRIALGSGFVILAVLVWFAERGFHQASRITLTKSCCCNNSSGDDFARHFRLADIA